VPPSAADGPAASFDVFLRHTGTLAFVVVDDDEPWLPVPWGDDVATYYGVDLREVALHGTRIQRPPGQEWHDNNDHPLLLGLVLERADRRARRS
jgi:CubicO group peptidase (beta-lactamase class C family)